MAHFARVEDNIVRDVIVTCDCDYGGCDPHLKPENFDHSNCGDLDFPEIEAAGKAFIASIGIEGDYVQTSYNGNFRGVYAGIGYTYDKDNDLFIAPPVDELPTMSGGAE